MRSRYFLIGVVLALVVAGGFVWAWSTGWFDSTVHDASATTAETTARQAGGLDEALQMAKAAQAKLQAVAGYRCLYLRDERIANEMNENYLKMAVRHEPFSVIMEWVDPP